MATISTLVTNLVARTSVFDRKMRGSGRRVNTFSKRVNAGRTAMLRFAKVMVAAAAAGGIAIMLKRTFEQIDATAKLARRLDISTEALLKLRHAAEITGAGTEGLDKALQKMAKSIGDVELGSLDAKYALDALGLDHTKLKLQSIDQQFLTVADAMKTVTNQTDKLAVAQKLFGRGGAPILNMLMLERKGLEQLGAEAEKLGLTFSVVDAARVEAANDAMTRLKGVMRGVLQDVAIKLAPVVESFADELTRAGTAGQGMGVKVNTAFAGIAKGIGYVLNSLRVLKAVFQSIEVVGNVVGSAMLKTFFMIAKGAETVASKLSGNKKDFTSGLAGFIDEFDSARAGKIESIKAAFTDDWPTEKIDKFFKAIENGIGAASTAAKGAAAGEALKNIFDQIAKTNEKLQQQVDLFGQSGRQQEISKLAKLGESLTGNKLVAFNARLDQTRALVKDLDKLDAGANMAKQAEKIKDSIQTPIEKFKEFRTELTKLQDAGLLTGDQVGAALQSKLKSIAKPAEVSVNAEMREIRTAFVDVAGLRKGQDDPQLRKLDEQINVLKNMEKSLIAIEQKEGLS